MKVFKVRMLNGRDCGCKGVELQVPSNGISTPSTTEVTEATEATEAPADLPEDLIFPDEPYDADKVHPIREPGEVTGKEAVTELNAIESSYLQYYIVKQLYICKEQGVFFIFNKISIII